MANDKLKRSKFKQLVELVYCCPAELFRSNPYHSHQQLADIFGVARSTIKAWRKGYRVRLYTRCPDCPNPQAPQKPLSRSLRVAGSSDSE